MGTICGMEMWTINRFVTQDCEWFVSCDYEVIGYEQMLMIHSGLILLDFDYLLLMSWLKFKM
jgi:hypothetical protein